MWIAFKFARAGIFSDLIKIRTGSPYHHCEIVLDGGPGLVSTCFGSSFQDGGVRTRPRNMREDIWTLVPVPQLDRRKVERLQDSEDGKGYDWFGALFWGTPIGVLEPKGRWFCSEICAYALGLDGSHTYSPGSLYRHLTEG